MNLITNSHLDRHQSRVIYELTLKKRQSKKSTMSEMQLAARKQLAHELMLERIIPIEDSILAHNRLLLDAGLIETATNQTNTNYSSNPSIATNLTNDDQFALDADQPSTSGSIESSSAGSNSACCLSLASSSVASNLNQKFHHHHDQHQLQQQPQLKSSPSCNSSGCSFGRSDSSYSGSSQASSGSARMMMIDEISRQEDDLRCLKKEASIKYNKTRLEQLNEELERRLYQYEYLVTKEKALLGTYNMVLFTNEGVNNFY